MAKGIEITRALAGYTRISYNGVEIAKHYLSATTQGTREAFEIPEEESVISWLENNFADEIKAIEEGELSEEIKKAIKNCVNLYRDEEGFEENLGNTLHENLSSNGIHAKDEDEFYEWEKYAKSILFID